MRGEATGCHTTAGGEQRRRQQLNTTQHHPTVLSVCGGWCARAQSHQRVGVKGGKYVRVRVSWSSSNNTGMDASQAERISHSSELPHDFHSRRHRNTTWSHPPCLVLHTNTHTHTQQQTRISTNKKNKKHKGMTSGDVGKRGGGWWRSRISRVRATPEAKNQ